MSRLQEEQLRQRLSESLEQVDQFVRDGDKDDVLPLLSKSLSVMLENEWNAFKDMFEKDRILVSDDELATLYPDLDQDEIVDRLDLLAMYVNMFNVLRYLEEYLRNGISGFAFETVRMSEYLSDDEWQLLRKGVQEYIVEESDDVLEERYPEIEPRVARNRVDNIQRLWKDQQIARDQGTHSPSSTYRPAPSDSDVNNKDIDKDGTSEDSPDSDEQEKELLDALGATSFESPPIPRRVVRPKRDETSKWLRFSLLIGVGLLLVTLLALLALFLYRRFVSRGRQKSMILSNSQILSKSQQPAAQ